jgi:hypothetical protein
MQDGLTRRLALGAAAVVVALAAFLVGHAGGSAPAAQAVKTPAPLAPSAGRPVIADVGAAPAPPKLAKAPKRHRAKTHTTTTTVAPVTTDAPPTVATAAPLASVPAPAATTAPRPAPTPAPTSAAPDE